MTDALRAITFFANVAFPAGQQRDGVKSANESTWDSGKANSEKAYAGLKNDFQQARQWASDKIAP
jgi:hypothetical protein